MNKLNKLIAVLLLLTSLVSCNKNDDTVDSVPPKAYSEQIPGEILAIEKFFEDYHMDVDADKNVEFVKRIGSKSGLVSIKDQYAPKFKTIRYNNYDFKVYYINHNGGEELKPELSKTPCPIDSVLVAYKGMLLKEKTGFDQEKTTFNKYQLFDGTENPIRFDLDKVIVGWSRVVSLMTIGSITIDPVTNTQSFKDFGAAVFFLPSGLAYYSGVQAKIPAYSPLIFNIKLISMKRKDHDFDGHTTFEEEYSFDASNLNAPWVNLKRDTDGDGYPNYIDRDDDNDGIFTKYEADGDDNRNGIPNYLDKEDRRRK
ncbi:FKBP-type peptidyl-prolyl cis-trans isomerase [Flavobacterium columnare]|uniref:FKBP-type peptidyl-prolyl cis-trans isomerase n=1 Tax=Flavobacterium columnare TaxID=996 RepID=UPI002D205ED0|nr:FKBP-type peptidyl-prolyl cis-trans isomerase [Flavobacterium columnare]MEB3802268.1 FKBP-type peptidyl-prolyl cis-trans isomerase [Flavobacterium columnare]